MRPTVGAAIVLALALAGLGRAAPDRHVSNLRIQLTASAVVPAPSDVSGDAHGRAVVRLSTADWIDLRHFNLMSKWRLIVHVTYTGLTGQATRVHIHTGRRWESPRQSDIPGMPLCRRAACRSPIHTSLEVSGIFVKHMLTHGAYVDVHTKRNPAGELRGQISVAQLAGRQ